MKNTIKTVGALFALALIAPPAVAQTAAPQKPAAYPSKPVRIIVGNAAGGGVDVIGRLLSAKLVERWNSPVVVENIAGGNGVIALDRAVQATPDGHTFIAGGASIEMHAVYKRFDVLKGLSPVVQMTTQPSLLVVSTEVRLPLKRFFESSFPRLVVLAYQELPPATEIENAGIVTLPPALVRAELPLKAAA